MSKIFMKYTMLIALIACIFMGFINRGEAEVKADNPKLEKATFAGGCFWCMEPPLRKLKGVKSLFVGYTGGTQPNPTYEQVSTGTTGYCEAVQILYDPKEVTYEQLLDVFWQNIDPTTVDKQFVDEGSQYRTEIFYHTEEQKKIAEESRKKIDTSGVFQKPVVTAITPASTFYPAEEYHQEYYKKNPLQYEYYHHFSGRDQFLDKTWGKNRKK